VGFHRACDRGKFVRSRTRRAFTSALLAVLFVAIVGPAESQAQVRTYYIAADDVRWNFAPSGRDLVSGTPLPSRQVLQLGWTFHKAIYRGYTDATIRHLKPRTPSEAFLGVLGPVIRAEVGDTDRGRIQEQRAAASELARPRREI
jgi:manganese oxidase